MAFGSPSLFGNGRTCWYNFTSTRVTRFVHGGDVKTFRWADEMFISATAKSELDFGAVVAELRRAFPESTMISDDDYATRLAGALDIARENGMPLDCAPIRCLQRNAAEHGIQRHLSVVLADGVAFNARVDKLGILAVTQDSDDVSVARPLLDVLREYPLEIETS